MKFNISIYKEITETLKFKYIPEFIYNLKIY